MQQLSNPRAMKRKEFIRITAAGLGALTLPAGVASCQSSVPRPDLVIPRSLLGICDSASLRAIGIAYRALRPFEDQVEELERLIAGELGGTGPLAEKIEAKISEEFRNGRWLEVSGWVLATTEARQCALYSLLTH